jgi:hypothetical protein
MTDPPAARHDDRGLGCRHHRGDRGLGRGGAARGRDPGHAAGVRLTPSGWEDVCGVKARYRRTIVVEQ